MAGLHETSSSSAPMAIGRGGTSHLGASASVHERLSSLTTDDAIAYGPSTSADAPRALGRSSRSRDSVEWRFQRAALSARSTVCVYGALGPVSRLIELRTCANPFAGIKVRGHAQRPARIHHAAFRM